MIQNMNVCRLLWGQFGGYGFYLDPIKSNLIYVRLRFWGQRWGQRVPRSLRVFFLSENKLNKKGESYEKDRTR